jgi:Kef-type K+ transport system membrane component KefB
MTGGTDLTQALAIADVGVVLLLGAALARVSRPARQPAVIGEIVAGIALGPSLLGLLPGHPDTWLFPAGARADLGAIAQIGLLLFMFTIGWELDLGRIGRAKAAVVAVTTGSMLVPGLLGVGAAAFCYTNQAVTSNGHHVGFGAFALYLALSMSITAFPVLARILADNGLTGGRVGSLVIACAALGDVIAWCLLAVVVTIVTASGPGNFMSVIGWSIVYVVVLTVVVRPLLRAMLARLRDNGPAAYGAVIVAAGIFLSSYATAWIGVHPIFGAFAFGLAMPRGTSGQLGTHVMVPCRAVSRLLLPVYFIVTGLSVNIGGLRATDYADLAVVLVAACAGKLIGTVLPARLSGVDWRAAFGVGMLMNTRGLTELIILNVGLGLGILNGRLFTVMVLMALVTTAMAGPLLPRLLPADDTPALDAATAAPAEVPAATR